MRETIKFWPQDFKSLPLMLRSRAWAALATSAFGFSCLTAAISLPAHVNDCYMIVQKNSNYFNAKNKLILLHTYVFETVVVIRILKPAKLEKKPKEKT